MTVANWVTLSRIFLIPVFAAAYFGGGPYRYWLALGVYLAAGLTDALDGYLSRRMNQVTPLGVALDPLADKLLLAAVLICLCVDGRIPLWVVGVLVVKESLQIAAGLYIWFTKGQRTIPANYIGKVSTALFYAAIIVVLVFGASVVTTYMVLGALGLSFAALISYGLQYRRAG